MIKVEVKRTRDPRGRPAVLLQLSDWWATLLPDDARYLAELLLEIAEEIDPRD